MSTIEKSPTRLAYIDALRGWAILLVTFGHCGTMSGMKGPLRILADHGMMGVYLFFVISAYTIFYMFDRHVRSESRPVRNFFIRRLCRIAPLYWLAIVYYKLIWGRLDESLNWHYVMNFFFLNSLNPEVQTSVVPGGWSISIEMLFYCAVPFLFTWIRNLSRATVFMLVCVFVFPLVTHVIYRWINPMFTDLFPLMVLLFWERFPLISIGSFSFGIWLYYLLKEEKVVEFFRVKAVNIAGLLFVALTFTVMAFLKIVYPSRVIFYSFIFMVFMLMLSVRPWKFLVNRFTCLVGRISYSMYIVHFSVALWLTKWMPQHLTFIPVKAEIYFLLLPTCIIIVSIPLAWCSYHLIERPMINFSNAWVDRLERKLKASS